MLSQAKGTRMVVHSPQHPFPPRQSTNVALNLENNSGGETLHPVIGWLLLWDGKEFCNNLSYFRTVAEQRSKPSAVNNDIVRSHSVY
jgi:hypothetical protein